MPPAQKGGAWFGFGSEPNYSAETGVNTGVIQYLYYFIVLTILLLFILVIVNYTLYPIFRTQPGGKGAIPIPGSNDAKEFWKNDNEITNVSDVESQLGSKVENWSYMLDIQVDNPTANTTYPRMLFSRGPAVTEPGPPLTFGENDTIVKTVPNFNTVVYLDRMTNDLNVAVQLVRGEGTSAVTMIENIVIPNVPVGKAIRLGVMVGSRVLEVYVNGHLVRSKTYTSSVKTNVGQIQGPFSTTLSSTARVLNLKLWKRPLSPAEFREYGAATDFPRKALPDSAVA